MTEAERQIEVTKMWNTLKVSLIFDPSTGSIKPWEVWASFSYPEPSKRFWGSYKTEENAQKYLTKLRKKYPNAC